jgi:hypothetical protein
VLRRVVVSEVLLDDRERYAERNSRRLVSAAPSSS